MMSQALATHASFPRGNGGQDVRNALEARKGQLSWENLARGLDFNKGYLHKVYTGAASPSRALLKALGLVRQVEYGRASVIEPLAWTDADGRELPQAEPWGWWDGGRVEELAEIG